MTRPFPLLARAHRLARDYLEPLQDRLGEDRVGLAIHGFMAEVVDFQARRLARHKLTERLPPEAPWLERDLYQLDACDRDGCIRASMPAEALALYQPDGRGWFMAWQHELWIRMMPTPRGRRPADAPRLEMIAPEVAAGRLSETAGAS